MLTPSEVIAIDPFLSEFCKLNSMVDESGNAQWNSDAAAFWTTAWI